MIDKVWARTHFRRGTKGDRDLRWDSAGSSYLAVESCREWSVVWSVVREGAWVYRSGRNPRFLLNNEF